MYAILLFMSETNNETAVRSRTTREESQGEAPLAPLVPGNEDPNRPLVELTHVEKHFGDLHVLKDINMTVTKGEVLVVVGPSGSGKSTMCRTINRLETMIPAMFASTASLCRRKARSSRISAPKSAWCSSPSTCSPTRPFLRM